MQEQQAVGIFFDGFHGIAAALEIVGNVEFQLGVARIGGFEDLIDFFGMLAERAHVIVVAERNSEIGGAFAEFGEQLAQVFVVRGGDRAILSGDHR